MEIAERVIKSGLSVRETEFLVKNRLDKNKKSAPVPALSPVKSEYYRHLESDASARLGRRVSIYENKDGKG